MPHDGVDRQIETRDRRPEHVETRPGVPRMQVPGKGDQHEDTAEEGEDGIGGVAGIGHADDDDSDGRATVGGDGREDDRWGAETTASRCISDIFRRGDNGWRVVV